MIIAIHHKEKSFSDQWIKYLKDNNISYKLVNAYSNNIIDELKETDAFMWHFRHNVNEDAIFAKQLFYSLNNSKVITFPTLNDAWFFDDKLGQKYLLESGNVQHAKLHAFYTKTEALNWLNKTNYPKVFKLRKGAGGLNVVLVKNKKQGEKLVKRAFSSGFSNYSKVNYLKDRIYKIKIKEKKHIDFFKALGSTTLKNKIQTINGKEKGYALFQDFIPNNGYDIRVVVVFDRAYSARRECRKNDFRASGSGIPSYPDEKLPTEFIKIAFDTASKLQTKSLAIDLVKNKTTNEVVVIEVSHAYAASSMIPCKGYWDKTLNWVQSDEDPQYHLMEKYIEEIKKKKSA